MKKSIFIITALLLSSVLLVACAKSETNEEGTPVGGTNELGTPVAGTTTEPITGTTTEPLPGTTTVPTTTLGTPVVGATEAVTPTVGGGSALGNQQPDFGRASFLLKLDVVDKNNDKLGTVEDLVVNLDSGRVQYVIVSTGGVAGIGDKEVAVPSALFEFPGMGTTPGGGTTNNPVFGATATPMAGAAGTPAVTGSDQDHLIFKADKSAFDTAPDWDASQVPAFGQPAANWDDTFATYWKTFGTPGAAGGTDSTPAVQTPSVLDTPAAGTTPAAPGASMSGKLQGVVLASKVIGMNIEDAAGNDIAEIKDIVIDTTNWKVLYIVIDYNSTTSSGGYYIPVPPAAFTYTTDGQYFTIVDADTVLVSAPHFTEADFPYTGTVGWDKDIQTFWNQNIKTLP